MRNYLCKLNFEMENCKFLGKFVVISSFRFYSQLYSYLRLQIHEFSINFSKICFSFVQNKIFEKSKMATKIADML